MHTECVRGEVVWTPDPSGQTRGEGGGEGRAREVVEETST